MDVPQKAGLSLLGVPVVGCDGDLAKLRGEYCDAAISIGGVGDADRRKRLHALASACGYGFPVIAHPKATLSGYADYGHGVFAGAGAIVNASCIIREMCILNSGCIVEHGCDVGAYAHVAPGAILCGGVQVGEGSHIGAGSVVMQGLRIGCGAIIGAGSVVTRDMPERAVAFGNPCRVARIKDST